MLSSHHTRGPVRGWDHGVIRTPISCAWNAVLYQLSYAIDVDGRSRTFNLGGFSPALSR